MKRAILLLLIPAAAQAQVASAALSGTVTDQSAAVVSGAALTLAQVGTGFQRAATSDSNGNYVFDELAPGVYTLKAQKKGFGPYEADGIALEVNQRARQDVRLAVGNESNAVTVTAAVSPVDLDDATVGYRMDNSKISELPLASRNVISLVTLGPGAIPRQLGGFVHDVNNDQQEGTRGSVALNPPINGARSTMNTFLLDGAYDTDRNTFAIAVYPPMDSVLEFHIQSSLAPAAFPESGGGAIDVVTKSGTRSFHGSGFEYLRNEFSDAHNYFDDPTLPRPIFRQNQFGGSLGGPMPLLKNTFFYGIYEGIRQKIGSSRLAVVPSAATRGGNFAGENTIYDPLTLDATGARTPFPGNAIPQARLDPIAQKYLAQYEPLPNSSASGGNYRDATPNQKNTDSVSGRIDHQFGNRGPFTGRYTLNDEGNLLSGSFPVLPTSEQVRAQQTALAYIREWGNLVSESRLSFTRLRMYDVPETAFHVNVAQELGLANPPTDGFSFGVPFFNVTDYSLVTDSPSLPQVQRDNLWHFSQSLSRSYGRHTLKFGSDFLHYNLNYLQSNLTRGRYDYSGAFTSLDGFSAVGGDPFADFLLGFPQDTTRTQGSGQAYMRQNVYAVFAQDEWRIAPRLTLNLGLRYEYAAPYTDHNGTFLNLDYSNLPNPPQLTPVKNGMDPDYNDFGPRVGLAWQFANRTVFRAGYGVYQTPEIAVETYDLLLNGLANVDNETHGNQPPVLTTQNGFPKTANTGFPSYFGVDPHAPTPYVQQWTASVQRELPGRTLLELAYIGSKGTHLGRYRQFNTPAHVETGQDLPPRPGDLQSLRTFPSLGPIIQRQHIANSSYNSLQVKVEKSMSQRLSLLASFVWSKSLDDADSLDPGPVRQRGRAGRAQPAAGARAVVRESRPAHRRGVRLPAARCAVRGAVCCAIGR